MEIVERPNSYYYFIKKGRNYQSFTNSEELTNAWLGTAAILPQYQEKDGSEGLSFAG